MNKVPKLKIDIRSQSDGDNTAVIDIDGEIGWASYDGEEITWNTPEAIKRKLREIQELKADTIVVNINSLGGYVNDGLAIHDVLAMHPAKITTNVIGMTASAATIIAQAGDVRRMSENALYLIHKSWGFAMGNANDMIEFAEELEVIDKRMLNIYTKRSGKNEADILAMMEESNGAGKWIDADEAEGLGLIDESFEPMKAAASAKVSKAEFMALGFPDVPNDGFEFKDEKEAKPATATVKVDAKDFLDELDKRISLIRGEDVKTKAMKVEEIESGKDEEENEDAKAKSDEVGPEGISRFEAQIKNNSNHI